MNATVRSNAGVRQRIRRFVAEMTAEAVAAACSCRAGAAGTWRQMHVDELRLGCQTASRRCPRRVRALRANKRSLFGQSHVADWQVHTSISRRAHESACSTTVAERRRLERKFELPGEKMSATPWSTSVPPEQSVPKTSVV